MYKAIDIARYIIKYSNESEYIISNLKLQKLLYFVQAYFLIEKDEPAFSDKIEAWSFGPVVPTVHREFKQYGSGNIPLVPRLVLPDPDNVWNFYRDDYSNIKISEKDKKLICDVVDELSEYSAVGLMKLTHDQNPWINAYSPQEHNEITTKSIKEYFSQETVSETKADVINEIDGVINNLIAIRNKYTSSNDADSLGEDYTKDDSKVVDMTS